MRRLSIASVIALVLVIATVTVAAQSFFPYAGWYLVTLPPPPCPTVERAMPTSNQGEIHVYYHCLDGSTKVHVFMGAPVLPPSSTHSMPFPSALYPNGGR